MKLKYIFLSNLILLGIFGAKAQNRNLASRPNIIFIYTDDQRFDALSVVQKEQEKRHGFRGLKRQIWIGLQQRGYV